VYNGRREEGMKRRDVASPNPVGNDWRGVRTKGLDQQGKEVKGS